MAVLSQVASYIYSMYIFHVEYMMWCYTALYISVINFILRDSMCLLFFFVSRPLYIFNPKKNYYFSPRASQFSCFLAFIMKTMQLLCVSSAVLRGGDTCQRQMKTNKHALQPLY